MHVTKTLFLAVLIAAYTVAETNDIGVPQASNSFAESLYNTLSTNEGNVFFSPLGIHAVLSMLYQGAAKSTATALGASLRVPEPSLAAEGHNKIINDLNSVKNITLHIANKVYVKTGIDLLPEYDKVIKEKFQSPVDKLNFEESKVAADTINSWVNDKTAGKIPTLFEETDFDKYTRLVLVNAIYFKGSWKHKFDKKYTRTEPFFADENKVIGAQMMHTQHNYKYKADSNLNAQVLEMPFSEEGVTLTFVLPFDRHGIRDLETKVEQNGVGKIFEDLDLENDLVVFIPKFKIETKIDLKEPLKGVGLGILFEDGKCDLTKMLANDEDLVVSKAIQKAYIEVNEEGAEAAAATGAIVSVTYSAVRNEEFRADHPFLVILRHGDTILFYGRIVEPISGDAEKAPTPQEAFEQYRQCADRALAEGRRVYEACV